MDKLIPIRTMEDLRGLHQEEFNDNEPLTSDLLMEIMACESSLYEYLADQAVYGNDEQTTDGHNHGRESGMGVYVARYGTFNVGHLFEQSTSSTSYQAVAWEIFNTGGPVATGSEDDGIRITCTNPSIYTHQDYKNLLLNVLMKVEAGATATARLTLSNDVSVLATSEITCTALTYTPQQFSISILNNESYTGWCSLFLELKTSSSSAIASIVSDDAMFKPLSGTILNGAGLLIGE